MNYGMSTVIKATKRFIDIKLPRFYRGAVLVGPL